MLASLIALTASVSMQGVGFSALGTPAWECRDSVLVTHRLDLDQLSLPIEWFDMEKIRAKEGWTKSKEGGWELVYEQEGSNLLILDPTRTDEGLSTLSALPSPVAASLPSDGTLVLAWDRETPLLQLQMGLQFADREGVLDALSTFSYIRQEEPPSESIAVDGKLEEVRFNREVWDFPKWSRWYVAKKPPVGEPAPENRLQATLGFLEVRLSEHKAEGSHEWRGSFRARRTSNSDSGPVVLCIAESSDRNWMWFWFEEATEKSQDSE